MILQTASATPVSSKQCEHGSNWQIDFYFSITAHPGHAFHEVALAVRSHRAHWSSPTGKVTKPPRLSTPQSPSFYTTHRSSVDSGYRGHNGNRDRWTTAKVREISNPKAMQMPEFRTPGYAWGKSRRGHVACRCLQNAAYPKMDFTLPSRLSHSPSTNSLTLLFNPPSPSVLFSNQSSW